MDYRTERELNELMARHHTKSLAEALRQERIEQENALRSSAQTAATGFVAGSAIYIGIRGAHNIFKRYASKEFIYGGKKPKTRRRGRKLSRI